MARQWPGTAKDRHKEYNHLRTCNAARYARIYVIEYFYIAKSQEVSVYNRPQVDTQQAPWLSLISQFPMQIAVSLLGLEREDVADEMR